ncbi:MAG TPA: hypothetical protein VJT54_09430 [Verrucomicrobiae bacterium]|nr:hypothetical protein [Verrucomicrobiae bacterium]
MKPEFLLCLALVLSGGLFGCSTVEPTRQETVIYSKPSSESLQKIKIERISLTYEQLAKSVVEPEDKRESGPPLLAEERPVWTRDGPWNTRLYIFNSTDTNRCVCVELLDHGAYEIHHTWLNDKMLFVEVPWGRLAWTDFVLNTKTLRFAYIEDGFACSTIEQQEEAESFNGYGLKENGTNGNGTNGNITSHIFGIEGKVIRIRKTSDILRSITVKLIKPLPPALGWIPYEKPGEVITIHFDEKLSELGKLQLATGSVIKVAFGNGILTLAEGDWGSNFSWLYVEKDGHFYNTKGQMMVSDPDDNQ